LWELYYQETLKMSTQTKINIKRHEWIPQCISRTTKKIFKKNKQMKNK
jgi:hypothetical protein